MRSRVTHLPVIFALGALAACASGGGGGGGAVVPGGATGNGGAASNSGNGNSNSNGAGGSNSGQPPAITQPPLVQAVVTYSDDPTKPLSWNVVGSGSGNAIGAPARGTLGANAGIKVTGCCVPAAGQEFPLLQSALEVTPSGISADAATNSGGATLTPVDTATGKYELSIPSLGVNYAFQIPMSPFPLGSYLLTPSSGDVVQFSAVGLHYGELGVWAVRSGSTGALKNFAFYTTGFPTTDLPKTGTATYRVVTAGGVVMVPTADGYSSAELWGVGGALTADFAAGAVSGALMFKAWDGNVSTPWNDVSVSATIAEGASRFSGTTAATNAPAVPFALGASATGSVEGNFYGPAAEEVGAIWSLSDGERSAIGLFGGSSVPPSGGGVSQGVGGELINNVP